MKIYTAPLEGITGHVFRTALYHHFGGADNTSSHLSDQIKMVILAQEKNKILCRRIT